MSDLSTIMHVVALCPRCGRTQSVIKVNEPADIITAGKSVESWLSSGIKVLVMDGAEQVPEFCKKYGSKAKCAPDEFHSDSDDCSPIDY